MPGATVLRDAQPGGGMCARFKLSATVRQPYNLLSTCKDSLASEVEVELQQAGERVLELTHSYQQCF